MSKHIQKICNVFMEDGSVTLTQVADNAGYFSQEDLLVDVHFEDTEGNKFVFSLNRENIADFKAALEYICK
jgi:hypothetical protein